MKPEKRFEKDLESKSFNKETGRIIIAGKTKILYTDEIEYLTSSVEERSSTVGN